MTAVALFPGFWTSRRGTPDNSNNPHASLTVKVAKKAID